MLTPSSITIPHLTVPCSIVDPPLLSFQVGSSLTSAGGFSLSLSEQTSRGPQDMDVYLLTVDDLLEVEITMRAAHSLLQTKDSAFVHFGVRVIDMQVGF